MEKGQIVFVESFDGKLVECRLIGVRGKVALVCNEQEWKSASQQGREPECLGWPVKSVRSNRDSNSHASQKPY